jgi:mRNA-degrading endonuclease toxin of MazEF toxin-antitoxin module
LERGEIWTVSLHPTSGHEQRGHRPVLVVTPAAFNRATGCPVVVPIASGGGVARRAGFAVALKDTSTTGIVRCDQPRAVDLAARRGRRVEMAPGDLVDEVLARLAPLFE